MAERHPVEVEADAAKIATWGLIDEHPDVVNAAPAGAVKRFADAIATALRTAQARGAEGMREAAARWHDNEAAEIRKALAAGASDLSYGRALLDEHKVSASAIRALPASDAPASPWRAINVVFDGSPGPVAGRFVEVETDDGKSINVGEWKERPGGWWALRFEGVIR